jgi:hypothetical protein
MLQDEAQRGAARVRQVEDEMGAVYETLSERDATIKSMQVRMNTRSAGRNEVRVLPLHIDCATRIYACLDSARTILVYMCWGLRAVFCRISIDCALFLSFQLIYLFARH